MVVLRSGQCNKKRTTFTIVILRSTVHTLDLFNLNSGIKHPNVPHYPLLQQEKKSRDTSD